MTGHPDSDPRGQHLPLRPSSKCFGARADAVQPSIYAQLVARLHQGRFDRMLAVGTPAAPGSALSVHAERIVTFAERAAVARTFREAVRDSGEPISMVLTARLPIHRVNVGAAAAAIDELTLRLHAPKPVDARGMARLRLLLSDGLGPFYRHGRGDLEGRLGAARAAL